MKARTFGLEEGSQIEVEIVSGPTSTGLCVVTDGERKYARHVDRLVPLDKEAREKLMWGRDLLHK